jgi:hypothetical protein
VAQLNLLSRGVTVTDAETKSFYDTHTNQFGSPPRAHIKRIILGTLSQATSIYNQIKAGGQFEQFVSNSLDHSSPDGDVNQWIPLTGSAVAGIGPLLQAVSATEEGEVAPPVRMGGKTETTYWIVKVVEKRPAETKSYNDVKDLIHQSMVENRATQDTANRMMASQELMAFMHAAKIEAVDAQYQPVIDALQNASDQTAAPVVGPAQPAPQVPQKPGQ